MSDDPNQAHTWLKNRISLKHLAEAQPIPKRFKVSTKSEFREIEIEDTRTHKRTEVSIFAYHMVRKVLNDLFSEDP